MSNYLPFGVRSNSFLQERGTGQGIEPELNSFLRQRALAAVGSSKDQGRRQRERPQTAHATLGEDCSSLWKEVGDYAEQRKLESEHSESQKPLDPTVARSKSFHGHGTSSMQDHTGLSQENLHAQANPASQPHRRPVSVYIARSARAVAESHSLRSESAGAQVLSAREEEQTSEPVVYISDHDSFRPQRAQVTTPQPPQPTFNPLTPKEAAPINEAYAARPRSAGVVHTNPSYLLPPRPYTANRRAASRRQLTWNNFGPEGAELFELPEDSADLDAFGRGLGDTHVMLRDPNQHSGAGLKGARAVSRRPRDTEGEGREESREQWQLQAQFGNDSDSERAAGRNNLEAEHTHRRPFSRPSSSARVAAQLADTALLTLPLFAVPGATANSSLKTTVLLGSRQSSGLIDHDRSPSSRLRPAGIQALPVDSEDEPEQQHTRNPTSPVLRSSPTLRYDDLRQPEPSRPVESEPRSTSRDREVASGSDGVHAASRTRVGLGGGGSMARKSNTARR